MSGYKNTNRHERGQSLIEFAFMLTVLLILLSVVVDGARAFYTYLSMRDAAQEGAMYASIKAPYNSANPTTADTTKIQDIKNRVRSASSLMESIYGDITISVTPTISNTYCSGATSGASNGVTITIDYENFPLTMPFVATFTGKQTVPIRVSATDTILSPDCP